MKKVKIPEKLRKGMEAHGYYFDELESYPGYICFTCCGAAFPIVFLSTKELREWLDGIAW